MLQEPQTPFTPTLCDSFNWNLNPVSLSLSLTVDQQQFENIKIIIYVFISFLPSQQIHPK